MKTDLLSYIREGRTLSRSEQLRLIVQLSIPSILAQISATVMFFIDAAMVGHLGERATAAIGLVESTTWLLGGLGSAASLGFSVQVAHFIGASDFDAARRVLRQSLVCCFLWSLMLAIVCLAVHVHLPYWLGGSAEIAHDASLYFVIIGMSAVFFQMTGLAGSMLKCSGNMKIPSMLNIGMCLMDVVFNYLFIYVLGMGVKGAAMGTGLAELVTAVLMLYFLLVRSDMLSLVGRRGSFRPKGDTIRTAIKIGAPMGLQHLLMGGAQIVSTIIVAPLGTLSIAANSLAITVESLCYMPGYGIAEAATTLVGQSIGAGQRLLTRSLAYMSVGLGMTVMTVMGALMYVFAPELMSIMTPVDSIIALGAEALRIEAWAEPMFAATIVANGVFIGAGETLIPAIMSLASMWGIRLTLAAWMAPVYGLRGVWTAMAIDLTTRGVLFLGLLMKGRWQQRLAGKLKTAAVVLAMACVQPVMAQSADSRPEVLLETTAGNIRIALYNETPKHRDNFLKLVQTHFFDSLLFHRVIPNFMIQGGDPDSRHAEPGAELGEGGLDYTLEPEFRVPQLYHKRGAVAAARESDDVNPERRSSPCQFYIVWGKQHSTTDLEHVQQRLDEATEGQVKLTPQMIEAYRKTGGTPHLDGQYTVFGEVVEGLKVVDKIQHADTDDNDRPIYDVRIVRATVVKR